MSDTTTKAPAPAAETAGPEAAPRRAWRTPREWLAEQSRVELAVWAGLIALALALRLYDLGSRPFHHDESQDAYFSYSFWQSGDYSYNPLLHGPLRFYLTALNYVLFGDSNFTARLAPALMGTLAVALPFLLRRQLGRGAALFAAVLLAFGPTYLYFSRFAREDIYIAAITLAMLVGIIRFLDRPRAWLPSVVAALLALSFATKESTFITLAVGVSFFAVAIAVQAGGSSGPGSVVTAIRSVGWPAWVYAFAIFWIVFAALFTVGFTQPSGLWKGVYDGLDYWIGQQPVNRGNEPWYFYLAVLFGTEWPVLLLGGVGIFFSVRRPSPSRLLLVWWFVVSLEIYSWASERFAWLALHPLLPMILLAGIGAQGLWELRSRVARSLALGGVAFCLAYVAFASFEVNALHGADPREWLVSTQSSVEVKQVANEVLSASRATRAAGRPPLTITVDESQGATFPYAWYFRRQPVGYIDMTTAGYVPDAQVLIMTEEARARLLPSLAAYDGRRFDFRVWWVRDWSEALSPGAWADWFTERKPWNPTGGMEEWLYVRKDAVPPGGV